jgi:hypothetical protein
MWSCHIGQLVRQLLSILKNRSANFLVKKQSPCGGRPPLSGAFFNLRQIFLVTSRLVTAFLFVTLADLEYEVTAW